MPEGDDGFLFFVVVVVDGIGPEFIDVEVGIIAGDDGVKLLVAEHGEPLGFHDLEEASSEEPGFLLDLFVAFEICVAHHELHLILAE